MAALAFGGGQPDIHHIERRDAGAQCDTIGHGVGKYLGFESAQQLSRRIEQLRAAVCALEIQVHVVFPGDRDAAVQLDALGRHDTERLGGGQARGGGVGGRGVDARVGDDGPGRGDRDIQVGHPMLERLEAADRPAELHSALGVFDGQFQTAFGGADLLGRQQDGRGVGDSGVVTQRDGLFGLHAGPAGGWGPSW